MFEHVEDYPGSATSVIECANYATIRNKEMSEYTLTQAINAFIFDKIAETCAIGRIDQVSLVNINTRPDLVDQSVGIHILQGCQIQGKQ